MNAASENLFQRIYAIVDQIPEGSVATYGQIAKLVGSCGARQVGYALAALPDEIEVPWHRVINIQGCISTRSHHEGHKDQRILLVSEGVDFNERGKIDLDVFKWSGPGKTR